MGLKTHINAIADLDVEFYPTYIQAYALSRTKRKNATHHPSGDPPGARQIPSTQDFLSITANYTLLTRIHAKNIQSIHTRRRGSMLDATTELRVEFHATDIQILHIHKQSRKHVIHRPSGDHPRARQVPSTYAFLSITPKDMFHTLMLRSSPAVANMSPSVGCTANPQSCPQKWPS